MAFISRHVNTGSVQRRDLLSQQTAVGIAVLPTFATGFFLCFVVAANPGGGILQSALLRFGQAVKGRFEIVLLQFQRGHAVGLQAVKACGVVQHRSIAPLFDIGQDVGHALFDSGIGIG
jgi:hypothetical protein